jgi:ribosomal protein S18 acetylase RimI-like enzyme
MKIVSYTDRHFGGIDALWQTCFPHDPPRNRAEVAIPAKLALADDLLLVAENEHGAVIGTVMAGYDGHRGWLYAVACAPDLRGRGVGSALVEEACARLAARGCQKVNLQVRAGNEAVAQFYRKLGFVIEPRVSMGRNLLSRD